MNLDFKKALQAFLLDGSFSDTESFLLSNHDTMIVSNRITTVEDKMSVFTINSQTKIKCG